MPINSYDDFIARTGSGYWESWPIRDEVLSVSNQNLFNAFLAPIPLQRCCLTHSITNPLPTGVSAYIPTSITVQSTAASSFIFGKMINFGQINLRNSVYTSGINMPLIIEMGVSRQIPSPVFAEVVANFSGAISPSLVIRYIDQDGNDTTVNTGTLGQSGILKSAGVVRLSIPDYGVLGITNISTSGNLGQSGIVQFWGVLPIDIIAGTANISSTSNLILEDFNFSRLNGGDVVSSFCANSLSTRGIIGNIFFVGDN